MKKHFFSVSICVIFGSWLSAQSLSPSIISAGGAESASSTMQLQWTLGELAVEHIPHNNGLITEGMHQSFIPINSNFEDLFSEENSQIKNQPNIQVSSSGYQIKLWPNPVRSILSVQIESDYVDEIQLELIDLMGKKVFSKRNYTPQDLIEINLSQEASGIYFLQLLRNDGSLIQTILTTKQ